MSTFTDSEIDSWCERIVRNYGDQKLPPNYHALAKQLPKHMGNSIENACEIIAFILHRHEWQPIATFPKDLTTGIFWVEALTADDPHFVNTSGEPILSRVKPHIHIGHYRGWSSLEKATHWMPDLLGPIGP